MWIQRLLPAAIGLVLVLALTGLRVADPAPLAALREAGFSEIERLAPRQAPLDPLVLRVEIDATSLAEIGPWPWRRDRLAQMVQRLDELQAAVIVLDLDLAGPDPLSPSRLAALVPELDPATLPDTDAALTEAIAQASVIVSAQPIEAGPPLRLPPGLGVPLGSETALTDLPVLETARLPLQGLWMAADAVGVTNQAGIAAPREWPLLWKSAQTAMPGLALQALRLAEGGAPITLPQVSDSTAAKVIGVGRYGVPVSDKGALRLYLAPSGSAAVLSASALLGIGYRRLAPGIEGRIVLVGRAESAAGLNLEAQAIEQIATGQFLSRPDWGKLLELAGFVVLAVLTLATALTLGPLAGAGAALAGGAVIVVVAWMSFVTQGLLLDATFPLAGVLLVLLAGSLLFATMVEGPRRRLRALFEGRLSPKALARVVDRPDRVALDGETRPIIVLQARLNPPATPDRPAAEWLRECNTGLHRLAQTVVAADGLVETATADRLVAIWNAPLEAADPTRKAALAALAMRRASAIRAGLASGDGLLGRSGIGHAGQYSALGDCLDEADNLQRAAGQIGYDIVLGEDTRGAITDFAVLDAGRPPIGPGGRREAVYLLVGDATMAQSGAFRLLALAHSETVRLLRDRGDPSGGLFECRSLAEKLEPGLVRFYELMLSRRADFGA